MKTEKSEGYEFYRDVLGSPKYIVAPMVDQSELAWRIFSRRYGAQLAYTPMINAKMFADDTHKNTWKKNFDMESGEEGDPTTDRPLIVQFCANDPEKLLISAKAVEAHCDAIDINLGCPQDIAKKGKYGAFLQDDWDLIYKLINILHTNLSIPVTAKFRVFPTVEKTVEYAKMLERAGAQILTCHGRIREQRGHLSGLADWGKIRAVKEAVSVPVFANGNILYPSDIAKCLKATGADGVMSAEGQLYNPALFANVPTEIEEVTNHKLLEQHVPHVDLALEYLSIVQSLKTHTSISAIKGHLFKILRPGLSHDKDLREKLGRTLIKKDQDWRHGGLQPYIDVCLELKERMEVNAKAAEGQDSDELVTLDITTGLHVLPHWLAQPYFRPLREVATKGADKPAEAIPAKRQRQETERTAEDESKKLRLDTEAQLVETIHIAV
ncbi:Dus-domain-containing protein [Armillaria solidipes]|uniref:tRNA-dihydrouridine(16/17) synthase [NAD(P)(+)] n=1 Tax=Armillaria solidipes TaxID=1076256 RepID=A0A2H3AXS3_9AGAR|nr:Dus-domain-containing protein [Armillaria solidipes]